MKNTIYPLPIIESVGYTAQMTHLTYNGEIQKRGTYIWYIDNKDKNIVVDTGGMAQTLENFDILSKQIQRPDEALETIGLSLEDIDTLIITHAHFDHIQYVKKFENAEIIIQRDELKAARSPHPIIAEPYEVIQPLLDEVDFKKIDGRKKIADGVEVLKTPGHTEGNQSVLVQNENEKNVIVGFCSVEENFKPDGRSKGKEQIIPPACHIDLKSAFKSIKKVKKIADNIIPIHEHRYKEADKI